MEEIIEGFPGEANRTRCFAHIINLCAKSMLRPFEVDTRKNMDALDEAEQALRELADELDLDTVGAVDDEGTGDENIEEADNLDGWVDECMLLPDEAQEELEQDVYPVKMVLTKVSSDVSHTWCIQSHSSSSSSANSHMPSSARPPPSSLNGPVCSKR